MYDFDAYLKTLIDEKELPGAVLHVQHKGSTVFHQAYGRFQDKIQQSHTMNTTTLFDIASLTKVVATLPSILWLIDNTSVELNHTIQTYIPELNHSDITIHQALTHTTGLPADIDPPFQRADNRLILQEVVNADLIHQPGSVVQYSDLGMILLGEVIERVSGVDLPTFTNTKLFKPWGLTKTMFNPPQHREIASTEWHNDHYVQGEVHDEKALHLGGASGSAGVFSIAQDVGKFGRYFLYPKTQQVLSPETIRNARKHVIQNRGLGFEVWDGEGKTLSCGRRWSEGSFSHTGFTGTSLWIDPKEELIVTFLTNIVHYGRNHNMRQIRPHLHSLIRESFTN
ncbi:serine hydrolase domain-containing protein [Guptibacillus hwajinpoensis]|uniref:serine hydrolase domain-containing protein n=1 Tax=Guptibacillus hwajinpoensis TaxID=208199 RepID=UPI00273D0B32|nr:serine hydrolase domain-containing protein [Pseudalkalibacillus hwajinpoensis]WLR61404.1 serine hydrolase domain-containing protein [Pseudalkalibacillus hwajinpoensis]